LLSSEGLVEEIFVHVVRNSVCAMAVLEIPPPAAASNVELVSMRRTLFPPTINIKLKQYFRKTNQSLLFQHRSPSALLAVGVDCETFRIDDDFLEPEIRSENCMKMMRNRFTSRHAVRGWCPRCVLSLPGQPKPHLVRRDPTRSALHRGARDRYFRMQRHLDKVCECGGIL